MSQQTKTEELLNTLSHGVGAILGIAGLIILLVKQTSELWSLFSILAYGISVIILFIRGQEKLYL